MNKDDEATLVSIAARRAELEAERQRLDTAEREAVRQAREHGYHDRARWDEIARALGISRQAAMKRHAAALANECGWQHRRRWDAGRSRPTASTRPGH